MPNSAVLPRSVSTCLAEIGSAIGWSMSAVGTLWSSVAKVRSGRRTRAPAQPEPVEGLRAGDLVDEVEVDVEQIGFARRRCRTTWRSQTFSGSVIGDISTFPLSEIVVLAVWTL